MLDWQVSECLHFGVDVGGFFTVFMQNIVRLKNRQCCQRRTARQRIARITMAVQKAFGYFIVIKRLVNLVFGQHARERQIAACNTFR